MKFNQDAMQKQYAETRGVVNNAYDVPVLEGESSAK